MARYHSGHMTYEFEELQIVPDHECYVFGEADISYDWEPDDMDTGYRGGFELTIESIRLYGTTKDDRMLELPHNHPLYIMIEEALRSDKYVHRIIGEIEESQW